jgi:hypothetical protein
MVNCSSGTIYPKGYAMFPLSLSSRSQKKRGGEQRQQDEIRSYPLLHQKKKAEIDTYLSSSLCLLEYTFCIP